MDPIEREILDPVSPDELVKTLQAALQASQQHVAELEAQLLELGQRLRYERRVNEQNSLELTRLRAAS
jgi:CHASE3 domain sensor protein